MAQYDITKILDGPRNALVHVSIIGTGEGDLVDEILIDPAVTFVPPLGSRPAMSIERLWYELSGFTAWLEFDYLTEDTPVWSMSEGEANYVDFTCFGGLKDRSNEMDGQGKLKISTNSLAEGDRGTLIVMVKKH